MLATRPVVSLPQGLADSLHTSGVLDGRPLDAPMGLPRRLELRLKVKV